VSPDLLASMLTSLVLVSEMNDGGTLFGDGIEQDRIELLWGTRVLLRIAPERLRIAASSKGVAP